MTKTPTQSPQDALSCIRAPVQADLRAADQLIVQELVSDIPLIQQITHHIIQSGGKRLRPLLVILAARATGYTGDKAHLELAAIIEFVHTATLLHDDVVDESKLRRGQRTANAVWGNQASVLVGDFLYSRAFQLLTRRQHTRIMQVLADTTNHIAEGEVLQLMNQHDPDITEADYLAVIQRKTAELFSAATHIGALLSTDTPSVHKAMAEYGLHLGLAFQIVDDLLDYTSNASEMGKNVGDDLAEGKATLPLIYTLQHADAKTAQHIRAAIQTGGLEQLAHITEAMQACNAFAYTLQKAKTFAARAKTALDAIPASPCRDSLHQLIDFVIDRSF